MRNLIIVDRRDSALYRAAKSRSLLNSSKVIIASDFSSPLALVKYLLSQDEEILLFSWRQALLEIYLSLVDTNELNELIRRFIIGVLIPDFIGLSNKGFEEEILINNIDFYLVTNSQLFHTYSKTFPARAPLGILHDIPDLESINSLYRMMNRSITEKPSLVWIGNSNWGKRKGYVDHKGLKSIVLPLKNICEAHGCIEVFIYDSAKKYIENFSILKIIKESNILLQCSKSEGTGLTLLEAIGLGTPVITTDVGVAREVFPDPSTPHIVPRDVNTIHERIHLLLNKLPEARFEMRSHFDRYIEIAISEVFTPIKSVQTIQVKSNFIFKSKIALLWKVRSIF